MKKRKIVSIVGARPQFIKVAPLARALRGKAQHHIIHTGQHYDYVMSSVFFDQLRIPKPKYHLNIGSSNHGEQTGIMLQRIEKVLLKEQPSLVVVYGDTNSTLAGALAAAKLNIPIAHVEGGMRSYNRFMPEEINRVLTDHLATLHLCSTRTAVHNLRKEGIKRNTFMLGDIMIDTLRGVTHTAKHKAVFTKKLGVQPGTYVLVTIHRAQNTDSKVRLTRILSALTGSSERIVFPLHPRTKKYLQRYGLLSSLSRNARIRLVPPLSYTDMLLVEKNAKKIVTDSGGIQKEAYVFGTPCITVRRETEWTETLHNGWNTLTDDRPTLIRRALTRPAPKAKRPVLYGDGHTARRIAKILTSFPFTPRHG